MPLASVSKRVSVQNHSYKECVLPLQVHFHVTQSHFHKKCFFTETRFEAEAQGTQKWSIDPWFF